MNPSEVAAILSELGAAPAKSRGQNFLVDDRVADRQIEYAELSPQDTVLEVGPGL
ncbi:MAG TPA: rRNA adenine N-6-methyltransferase family protein, partial [Methanomassiliicoccaceae archaeon]|nr:rRNA adenine N-6-methyltransferase family protein [Methanomassiliicoccaceae archaeon]